MKKIMAEATPSSKTKITKFAAQSNTWIKLFFVVVIIVATFQLLRDLQSISNNQPASNPQLAEVLQASSGNDGVRSALNISPYLNDSYNRCQNKAGLSMEFSIDGSNSVSRDDMQAHMQQMYNTGGRFINIDVNLTAAGQLSSAVTQGVRYVKEAHNQHLVPAFSLEGGRDSAFFDDSSFVADFYKGIAEGVGENKYFVATTLQDYYFEESPSVVNSSSSVGTLAVEAAEALQDYPQIIIGTPQFPIWQDCTEATGGTSCVQLIEEEDFRVHSKLDAYIKDGAMTDEDFSKFDMLLLQIKNRDDDFKIGSSKYAKRGYGMYSLIARYINNIQRDEFKRSMRTMIFDYGIAPGTTPGNPDDYTPADPKIQRERLAYDFFEFSSDPYVDAVFFDSEAIPGDKKFQTVSEIQDKGSNCYYDLETYPTDVYTPQGKANPVKTETVTQNSEPARVNIVCDPESKRCETGFQFTTQVGLPIRSFGSNSAAGTDTKPFIPLSVQLSSQVDISADFLNQYAAKLESSQGDYSMPWLGNALNAAYPGLNYFKFVPRTQFDRIAKLNSGVYPQTLEEGAYDEYWAYVPGDEVKQKVSDEEVVYSGSELGVKKDLFNSISRFREYSPQQESQQVREVQLSSSVLAASTSDKSCKTGINFAVPYGGVSGSTLDKAANFGYGYGLYIMYGDESSSDIAAKLSQTCDSGIAPVLRSCDATNDCNFSDGTAQAQKIIDVARQTSCNEFYAICGHNEPITEAPGADQRQKLLGEGRWAANCVNAISNSAVADKVKITTPTFNSTYNDGEYNFSSDNDTGNVHNFIEGYNSVSNFESDKSKFACVSFNTYDRMQGSSKSVTDFYDDAMGLFPGMKACVMESGADGREGDPGDEAHKQGISKLLDHAGEDLEFALGFNFMGNNGALKDNYMLTDSANAAVASCQNVAAEEKNMFINNDPQNMIYGSEQVTKEVSLQDKLGTTHANEIVYKWLKGGVKGELESDDYTVKFSEQCRCQNNVEGLITPYATERRLRNTSCALSGQQLKDPDGPQCVEYLGGANNYAESKIYIEENFSDTPKYSIPGAYDALAALYNEVQTRLSERNEKLIFNERSDWEGEIMQRAYRKMEKPEYQISEPRKNNYINHAAVLGESTTSIVAQASSDNSSPDSCFSDLTGLGLEWETWNYIPQTTDENNLQCRVQSPLMMDGNINGVEYLYFQGRQKIDMRMSCKLAKSLYELGDILKKYDIEKVLHAGTYLCREIAGTEELSQHGTGNAIDIWGFIDEDGSEYILKDHWKHDTDSPDSEKAKLLKDIENDFIEQDVFTTVLNPDYNSAYDNHWHVDVKDGPTAYLIDNDASVDPNLEDTGESISQRPVPGDAVVKTEVPGDYNFRYKYYPADQNSFKKERLYYEWLGAIDQLVKVYDMYLFDSTLERSISTQWTGWPDCESEFAQQLLNSGVGLNCIADYAPKESNAYTPDPLGQFLCDKGYNIVGECEDQQVENSVSDRQCGFQEVSIRKPFSGDYPVTQEFGNVNTIGITPSDEEQAVTHNGVDYGMPVGTEILAAQSGRVVTVVNDKAECTRSQYNSFEAYYNDCGRGNFLTIRHESANGEAYYTQYSHLRQVIVSEGQEVSIGQPIAISGNTGRSTGPHLDLQLRIDANNGDSTANPLDYLVGASQADCNISVGEINSSRNFDSLNQLINAVSQSVSANLRPVPPEAVKAIMHMETADLTNDETGNEYTGDPLAQSYIQANRADAAGPMQFTPVAWLEVVENTAMSSCLNDIGIEVERIELGHRTYLGPALCAGAVKLGIDVDRYTLPNVSSWSTRNIDPVNDLVSPLYSQDVQSVKDEYEDQGNNLSQDVSPLHVAARAYFGACLYDSGTRVNSYCEASYNYMQQYANEF